MRSFSLSLLFLLAGCAVGPNYRRPDTPLPSHYVEGEMEAPHAMEELREWWTTFNDPILDELIEEGLRENYDLKIAQERIYELRALYQIEAAELYPTLDLNAEAQRNRTSQSLFDSTFLGPPYQNYYSIGFDASWEIDLFGKLRRAKERTLDEYEAEIESGRDVLITLLGDIATTYIDLRAFQRRVHLTERDIAIQKELLALSDVRFEAGLESEIAPQEIENLLTEKEALLPALETHVKQALYRLATLLGRSPEGVSNRFNQEASIPIALSPIPVGLPSDLLRRRPDIRRAERLLAAETAGIGEAIADLFPRFSLMGAFGFESNRQTNWFRARSKSWTFGPSVDWPILYFGRIRANIRAQNARQKRALYTYEQTLLTSLEEVENRLVSYYKEEERYDAFDRQLQAAYRIFDLTRDQYLSGLTSFTALLEADQAQINAENNLIDSMQALSLSRVALYKALGGEW